MALLFDRLSARGAWGLTAIRRYAKVAYARQRHHRPLRSAPAPVLDFRDAPQSSELGQLQTIALRRMITKAPRALA
jgi:hypothetical protein